MVVKAYEACVTGVAMLDHTWKWVRSEGVQSYSDITALMPYELLGIFGVSVLYVFVSVWCFSGDVPVGFKAYVSALQRTTFFGAFLGRFLGIDLRCAVDLGCSPHEPP